MSINTYDRGHPIKRCANCYKKAGVMLSSDWGHERYCCSDVCGKRYGVRLANGMLPHSMSVPYVFPLRIQAKILSHRLKVARRALSSVKKEAAEAKTKISWHRRRALIIRRLLSTVVGVADASVKAS